MKCPCIKCENKGCVTFHDQCEPYQKYSKDRKDDRSDIRKRYDFAGKRKKQRKGTHHWEHQNNISY